MVWDPEREHPDDKQAGDDGRTFNAIKHTVEGLQISDNDIVNIANSLWWLANHYLAMSRVDGPLGDKYKLECNRISRLAAEIELARPDLFQDKGWV